MGKFGNELVPEHARILTHCNAGALATAGYGTALEESSAPPKKPGKRFRCSQMKPDPFFKELV